MWDIQLKSFFGMLYWVNIVSIVYGPTLFSIKLSILLQYLRIFVPDRKGNMPMYIAVHVCIWSIFGFYLIITLAQIAACQPREKIWDPLMTTGHCFSQDAINESTGIFNIISDFAILILPMPSLWKLQLPSKQKVLVSSIFATGFLACLTSILRTYYTWRVVESPDISYNIIIMGIWAYVEVTIGIIISCLPILPRFVQHFGPRIHGRFFRKSKSWSSFGNRTGSSIIRERAETSAKIKKPTTRIGDTLLSDHWDHPYHPSAEIEGEYITLDDYDKMPPRKGATSESTPKMAKGTATRREGLENGLHTFEIRQTVIPKTN
ncbi:hypothetical protein MMC28_000046 [Mycoblastus sanguinarius]|nr:hypothetical protein [Mycoblastus sanguinarius]